MKKWTVLSVVVFWTCLGLFVFAVPKTVKVVVPKNWPSPVYDFKKNPLTTEGVELGKRLFYDPLLSRDSTISCASCHLQYTGFTHIDHAVSHGIEGKKGIRNTQSLSNLAWSSSFLWDGGVNNLEVQPLAPIENPVEMDNSLPEVVKRLNRSKRYRQSFQSVFSKQDSITGQQVLKALSQFMLSLQSYNSKYDQVMRAEKGVSFTSYEERGLAVFRANCASCHTEPLFTNNAFENNGLPVDPELKDVGRMRITGKREDSLRFKVPSLRNVEVSYPYMHDGRFKSLQMVLFHYTNGIEKNATLSSQLRSPLSLSSEDKACLVAFLKTLTDERFLRDKQFFYEQP